MKKASLLLTALWLVPCFGMEEGAAPSLNQYDRMAQFLISDNSSITDEKFGGTPIEQMEEIFENAPEEIKLITDMLRGTCICGDDTLRGIFLVGEPSTGKSILAKAIAFKANWKLIFKSAADFISKTNNQRNTTAALLKDFLEKSVSTQESTVVVLDELNEILEHAEDSSYDSHMTSMAFWTFFDSQLYNKRFFIIGTMNRSDQLPKQIASRTILIIELPLPVTLDKKREVFLNNFITKRRKLKLDEEGEKFLDEWLEKVPNLTARDFQKMGYYADFNYLKTHRNASIIEVGIEDLKAGFNGLLNQRKLNNYNRPKEETEAERAERHHKENLSMQDLHFVQQHLNQLVNPQTTEYYYDSEKKINKTTTQCTNPSFATRLLSNEQYANLYLHMHSKLNSLMENPSTESSSPPVDYLPSRIKPIDPTIITQHMGRLFSGTNEATSSSSSSNDQSSSCSVQ